MREKLLRLLYAAYGADSPDTPHTVNELTLSDGRLCVVVFSPSTRNCGIACSKGVKWGLTGGGEQGACNFARLQFDAQYRAEREAEQRELELLAGDDW